MRPYARWLLLALAVAILIRATRLGESLWYDEIVAWAYYGAHGPSVILTRLVEPANQIAHTLLSWASVELFDRLLGFELALRLPALLFSLGAVAATAAMVRRALGDRAGIVAAFLMAILPVPVLEGVEARGYSMMICLAALANRALLANVAEERAWRWVLYAGICAAGVWTHFVAAFVPAGHAAWLAWLAFRAPRGPRGFALRGAAAIAGAGALSLVLYAPVLPDLAANLDLYRSLSGREPAVLGPEGWHAILQLGGAWSIAALPSLALLVAGAARAAKPPLRDAAAISLAGLPLFVLAVVVTGSWMYARFTLFALPGAILLMAAGFEACLRWKPAAGVAAAVLVVAASGADLALRPPKQPLRDAAEYVRANKADGDRILAIGLAHPVIDVYLGDLMPAHSMRHGADLEERLAETDPAWVVICYPQHVAAEKYELLAKRGFAAAERFPGWVDWGNGDVLVYARSPDR